MLNSQATGFLERANCEVFGPRGLVALVCTFSREREEVVRYNIHGREGVDNRISTRHFIMPQSKELIYLDSKAVGGRRGIGKFVSNYYNRRSQVVYISLYSFHSISFNDSYTND